MKIIVLIVVKFMIILQFQFTKINDKELDIIPDFIYWLRDQMIEYINTPIIRKKIQLRINYLYKVKWIKWEKIKYIDVESIMNTFYQSITYKQLKNNTWVIKLDDNIRIPGTYTPMSRLIRFLNSGDINNKGIGLINKINEYYNHNKLNFLWQMFVHGALGSITNVVIIS